MEPITEERHTLSVDLRTHPSENRLVDEAVAGSGQAFEGLFQIHYAGAMRVASACVRSAADAEDVVQESFIKAWRAIDRFETSAPFGPWLRMIVMNEARTRIRSNARRARAAGRLEHQFGRTRVPDPSAEDLLLAGEVRGQIGRALEQLSRPDQRVIRLRYELDLNESDMAEQLDVPPGTVKPRLSRALGRLREHMVIVILALLALTAVTVPPVRAAIENLLGITGAEKVIRVPQLPEHLSPRPFDWGPVVDPGTVGTLNPFGADLPSFNGIEPVVRLRSDLNRPMLTFVYGADTATIVSGRGPVVLAKLVPPGIDVRQVRIPGGEGLWIPGGMSHALATLDSNNGFSPGPKTRINSGVLALQGPDGRDYRIQTARGLEHALDLARTLYSAAAVSTRR